MLFRSERIGRNRRTEKIVRLEVPDCLPKRRQEFGAEQQTGFAGNPAIWKFEHLEFVPANARRIGLFRQPHAFGVFASAEMVPGFTVGANQDAPVQVIFPLLAKDFEGAGGGEFEIVKMGMDKEGFHKMWLKFQPYQPISSRSARARKRKKWATSRPETGRKSMAR